MAPKLKNTTFFNFLSTKDEENNNNAGAVPSSSDVSIRNMGPRTNTVSYVDKWTFKKELTASDILGTRLHLPKGPMLDGILEHLSGGGANVRGGVEETIRVKDVDEGTYIEDMIIYADARKFWMKGHWVNEFVNQKNLQAGYTIGFCWNDTEGCLEFSVLDP